MVYLEDGCWVAGLNRIQELLDEEAIVSLGVKKQVEALVLKLRDIQSLKVNLEKKQVKDEQLRDLRDRIEDIFYEAEDVVESYVLRVPSRRRDGVLKRMFSIFYVLLARHQVTMGISTLNEKIHFYSSLLYGISEAASDYDLDRCFPPSYGITEAASDYYPYESSTLNSTPSYSMRAEAEGVSSFLNSPPLDGITEAASDYNLDESSPLNSTPSYSMRAEAEGVSSFLNSSPSYGIREAAEGESSTIVVPVKQISTSPSILQRSEFIGQKEVIEEVVSLLQDKERKGSVIAICGMGGSGKTMLVKHVYQNHNIRNYFEGFAWVTIGSDQYQAKPLLRRTLAKLIPDLGEEIKHLEDITLVQKISEVLKSKKCLVVLDDVWDLGVWESLGVALWYRGTDSKVLITTRSVEIAERTAGMENVRTMRFLSEEETWDLFISKALPNNVLEIRGDTAIKTMVMDMLRDIAGGLPLIVLVLANMFSSKPSSEWAAKVEYVKSALQRKDDSDNQIALVLSTSYKDLFDYLKPCLLYLGCFPEDSIVEADALYLLWIAEGILPSRPREVSVMEKGSRYLEELAKTSLIFVNVDEVSTVRKVKSCHLHDLVRDFCLERAIDDNFLEVINFLNKGGDSDSSTRKTPRLAIYLDKYEHINHNDSEHKLSRVMETADYLRSLLFFNAYNHEECIFWTEEKFNIKEFRVLRVLHFEGIKFQSKGLPKGIGSLFLLTYLSLRGCCLKELAGDIDNLLNLRTLDLRVSNSCKMIIPNILWKLKRLQRLYLPVAFQPKGDDKLRFEGLTELQILKNFDTRLSHAQHLLGLTNMQILDATTSGNNEDLKAIIKFSRSSDMCQTTLDVREFDCYSTERHSVVNDLFSCNLHTLHIDGHMEKLPQTISQILTKLSFISSGFLENSMATLAQLPHLCVLEFGDTAYVGADMVCPVLSFPELRQLQLSGLHKLQRLTIEDGAMPKLSALVIEKCERLEVPIDGLRRLWTLKELKVSMMPEEFEDGLRIAQEIFPPGLSIEFLHDEQQEKLAPCGMISRS